MTEGWIKAYRKFIDWGWYKDVPVFKLFMHLLLIANHKDTSYRGETIHRGQTVVGRNSLANDTGLSPQEIRTATGKLVSTNEITIKSTNSFSIITICNYDIYQGENSDINQHINQRFNQQSTTSKEDRSTKEKVQCRVYSPQCRSVLLLLNEITGSRFRETSANLDLIQSRLDEEGVDSDTVHKMIRRQCGLWMEDPKMRPYLRPQTLFNKTKFENYYANANLPINGKSHPINPRNKGTFEPKESYASMWERKLAKDKLAREVAQAGNNPPADSVNG